MPRLSAQVNLRHFALQGPKYASISDVVVYGENGIDESVVETARQVREAMDYERQKRGGKGLEYNVYVIAGKLRSPSRLESDRILIPISQQNPSRSSKPTIQNSSLWIRVVSQGIVSTSLIAKRRR